MIYSLSSLIAKYCPLSLWIILFGKISKNSMLFLSKSIFSQLAIFQHSIALRLAEKSSLLFDHTSQPLKLEASYL